MWKYPYGTLACIVVSATDWVLCGKWYARGDMDKAVVLGVIGAILSATGAWTTCNMWGFIRDKAEKEPREL